MFTAASIARADFSATVVSNSVVDPTALTVDGKFGFAINGQAFQQPAILSFSGWQYTTYYDAQRHVCIARRQLSAGAWQIIRFTDYQFTSDDIHNVANLGICPKDGTIHLAFDHHVSPLHYRVSKIGAATSPAAVAWDATLFGPITDILEKKLDHLTYPIFLATPEGNLQFFCRLGGSGHGDRWMIDYDGNTHAWHDQRQIDSGTGIFTDHISQSDHRNGYENGYNYDTAGRLHSTWCWRESATGSANHDLCYAWSDDEGKTWHNNAGQIVNSGDGQKMIALDSPGITVVPIDRDQSLMNQQTQSVDSMGRIHVVMWRRIQGHPVTTVDWDPLDSAYYHYYRDDSGKWQISALPGPVGNRPKLFFDAQDNAYVAMVLDRDAGHSLDNLHFLDGELRIVAATAASHWTDWKVIYTDPAHYMNEPLGDIPRFQKEGILSLYLQDTPSEKRQPSPLCVLDLKLTATP